MANQSQVTPAVNPEAVDIAGKSIVVTGGTTGIGRATALLLARRGAKVFVFGRHEKELQDALKDLKKEGGQVFSTLGDTTSAEDISRIFREAESQMGGIDILVNNAALAAHDVASMSVDEIVYVIQTNLLGYMLCSKEAISRMKAKGEGHIVNVGSMSAQVMEKGSSVYVGTKAGIRGFTVAMRKEVNAMGIKVTLIEPGLVGTDMTTEQVEAKEQPKKIEEMQMLKAEDIAEAIYYALIQPKRTDVVMVQVRPHLQEI